jgi:hypothetical protein
MAADQEFSDFIVDPINLDYEIRSKKSVVNDLILPFWFRSFEIVWSSIIISKYFLISSIRLG